MVCYINVRLTENLVKRPCKSCVWRRVQCRYPEYLEDVTPMTMTPANKLTSDIVRDWDGPLGDILSIGAANVELERADQVEPVPAGRHYFVIAVA
jgi:hypothetical protein